MTEDNDVRQMPMSPDAERTILGAVLLDHKAYAEAAAKIGPGDFYLTAHQKVFLRMGEMLARRQAVDIVTLSEELSQRKELESVGGVAWLASLTEGLPRRISIGEYVSIVRDKSTLRTLINIHSRAITRAADQSEDADSILAGSRYEIDQLATERSQTGLQPIAELLAGPGMSAEELISHPAKQAGVPSGIIELDQKTCGFQPAEMVIVAARPSMGKSDFGFNVADYAAVSLKKATALYTIEMSKKAAINRMICSRARVDRQRFRDGKLSIEDQRYFSDAREELLSAPLYISDVSNITLSRIRNETLHLKARSGLEMVVVDYLGLMSAADMPRKYNREQEVAGISRGFKLLAKDLDVPVVVLAQISRDNTKRSDKRPMLSDLRESGSIEQDADVVAFLHREEYYDPKNADVKGKGEIIVAKQRNGPVGTVDAIYNGAVGRWGNPQEDEESYQESFRQW